MSKCISIRIMYIHCSLQMIDIKRTKYTTECHASKLLIGQFHRTHRNRTQN